MNGNAIERQHRDPRPFATDDAHQHLEWRTSVFACIRSKSCLHRETSESCFIVNTFCRIQPQGRWRRRKSGQFDRHVPSCSSQRGSDSFILPDTSHRFVFEELMHPYALLFNLKAWLISSGDPWPSYPVLFRDPRGETRDKVQGAPPASPHV